MSPRAKVDDGDDSDDETDDKTDDDDDDNVEESASKVVVVIKDVASEREPVSREIWFPSSLVTPSLIR